MDPVKAKTSVNSDVAQVELNPVTKHFEFSGPHLTLLLVVGMALTPFLLFILCDSDTFCSASFSISTLFSGDHFSKLYGNTTLLANNLISSPYTSLWSWSGQTVFLSWMLFHAIMYKILPPDEIAQGTVLRDGSKLSYPINAYTSLLVTWILFASTLLVFGIVPFVWIADNYLQLSTAAVIYSIIQSVFLYLYSFRKSTPNGKVILAVGGNSGYPIYDFFIGRELNPRLFGIDLKYFCELRPGLIGWMILNASLAVKQG